jgi:co-chaperonin GroES (HSP10)
MKHTLTLVPALVLALLVSAQVTAGVQTEEKAAVNAKGTAATAMTISKVTATVEDIDLESRLVSLVGPKGKHFVVEAGEKVRNLAQVKVGDKVVVEYYEGLVAQLNPPDASQKEVKVTDAMVKAAAGERPAGAVGTAITATVVIQYVDSLRNVVHFKGPKGKTRIVKVMKPEFRAMLKKMKVGDQVALTYFEAAAVSVEPAKK